MDVRSGTGSFKSRDVRLGRALRILPEQVTLTNTIATRDPDGDELVVSDFTCQSQSSREPYHGRIEFNGQLVEEGLSCSCPDFANGFLCKHAIAALLKAGCPEEYLS